MIVFRPMLPRHLGRFTCHPRNASHPTQKNGPCLMGTFPSGLGLIARRILSRIYNLSLSRHSVEVLLEIVSLSTAWTRPSPTTRARTGSTTIPKDYSKLIGRYEVCTFMSENGCVREEGEYLRRNFSGTCHMCVSYAGDLGTCPSLTCF